MKNIIKQFIPKPIRPIIRKFYYFLVDAIDLLLSRRDELTPPKRMMSSSGLPNNDDFKKIGEEFLQYFIDLCGLKPNEKVLDVECGIGQMAIFLTKYLNKEGSYEWLDIVADEINWCRKKISPKYSNFHFQLANVFNKYYNPKGKYKASEYKFPYENESFDFVFLKSVFTHILPQDMENYFSEISRVLRKDGRCLITFFLLNNESLKLISNKKSTLDFKYFLKDWSTVNKNIPEAAIAYNEKFIRRLYESYRLNIKEPIYYRSWCGKKNFLSYQDIIVASKNVRI